MAFICDESLIQKSQLVTQVLVLEDKNGLASHYSKFLCLNVRGNYRAGNFDNDDDGVIRTGIASRISSLAVSR
jgi:hypothetical protein